jgi:hypothetical protein
MTFEVGAFPAAPFKGAAGDGHGALVLAGRDGSAAGKGSWQVHLVGRAGESVWVKAVAAPGGVVGLAEVVTAVDLGELGVALVGDGDGAGGEARPVVALVSPGGAISAAPLSADKVLGGMRTRAAARYGEGLVWVGTKGGAGPGPMQIARASAAGAVAWVYTYPWLVRQVGFALVASADRLLVGFERANAELAAERGKLLALTGAGAVAWESPDFTSTLPGPLRAFAAVLDGHGEVSLLRQGPGGGAWASLSLDAGAPTPSSARGAPVTLARSAHRGGALLATSGAAGATTFLNVYSKFGNPAWSRPVLSAPAAVAGVAATTTSARIALFGADLAQGQQTPVATVLDRWGAASCAERGACAGASWSSCDDGLDCTADGCTATAGCVHVVDKANHCDPASPCTRRGRCATGACQMEPYGRVGVVRIGAAVTHAAGLTRLPGEPPRVWALSDSAVYSFELSGAAEAGLLGGPSLAAPDATLPVAVDANSAAAHVAAITVTLGARTGVRLLRYPGAGKPPLTIGTYQDGACLGCSARAVAVRASPDGGFLVASNSDRFGGMAVIQRVTPAGALGWTREVGASGAAHKAHGLRPRANGGAVWVGQAVVGGQVVPSLHLVAHNNSGLVASGDVGTPAGLYRDVAERLDGGFVAVGAQPIGSMWSSLLAGYDAKGGWQWRLKTAALPDGVDLAAIVRHPDEGYAVAGTRFLDGVRSLVLERRAEDGTLRWRRLHL